MSEGYRRRKRSIKGWLILPVLGLVLTPVRVTIDLFGTFLPLFQNGTIAALLASGSEHYRPAAAAMVIVETIVNGFIVLGAIFLLYLLVQRSRFFPWGMIILYTFNLLFILSDLLILKCILNFSEGDKATAGLLTGAIISAGIWVPYFVVSKRVKETFVR